MSISKDFSFNSNNIGCCEAGRNKILVFMNLSNGMVGTGLFVVLIYLYKITLKQKQKTGAVVGFFSYHSNIILNLTTT